LQHTAITTDTYHSCALRANGTITCWGSHRDSDGNYIGLADAPSGQCTAIAAGAGAGVLRAVGRTRHRRLPPPVVLDDRPRLQHDESLGHVVCNSSNDKAAKLRMISLQFFK